MRLLRFAAAIILALACSRARATGIDQGPYLMHPTQTGITVCWISGLPTIGAVTLAGRPEPVADAAATSIHRVSLTGLKPYTRYVFTVACDGVLKSGSFTTAAPPKQPFKFVAYGDNRTNPQIHATVLERMREFRPDFIVQSGDQVADGTNEAQWSEFWRVAGKMLSETAYYPSLGNHENHGAPYYRFFDLPSEYAFDYGNAHFVALDSNRPASEYAAQEEWLRRDLLEHKDAEWRIVFFHHTVHTCTDNPGRRLESIARAKRLEPVFAEGRVQLVINGHDHNYQRHVSRGTTYIVTGGGGAPLYGVTPDTPFVKMAKSTHHHCELSVNGGTISVRVVQPDGEVIEEYKLRSGSKG